MSQGANRLGGETAKGRISHNSMGEVWLATARITELCLQLTPGSRPVNGDEHRALRSQSCERALLTMGDFTFTFTYD